MNSNGSMPRLNLPTASTVTEPADLQALHRVLLEQATGRSDAAVLLIATDSISTLWSTLDARWSHEQARPQLRELAEQSVAAVLQGLADHYHRQMEGAALYIQGVASGWITQIRMTAPATGGRPARQLGTS
ncbi:hypothetical protein L3Q67_45075 (plasmid) [Saccharothrix sp. AJ9571]|nr:hypothetical protein L3Q67_45075 [Saccharothrix sp. AJ9571]